MNSISSENAPNASTSSPGFTITTKAAQRIKQQVESGKMEGSTFRIEVKGGGCAGFQYKFSFTDEITSEDHLISLEGATVAVDETSLNFLGQAILDYVETLGSSSFEVINPAASSRCGCGSSFSL